MWCRVFLLCCLLLQNAHVLARTESVSALYADWQSSAVFNKDTLDKSLLQQFVKNAQNLTKLEPDNACAWALSGLIKAFYASQVPNIEGLKMAKQGRDELQHALSLDSQVFAEFTYAELGYLYHNTPGWPFSFGSQPMAEKLLNKALELDPHGVISNLRMGEYRFDQKEFELAQFYLQTAVELAGTKPHVNWLDFELLKAKQMMIKIHK